MLACGSHPMARPFVAQPVAQPPKKSPKRPSPKDSAGRVTFSGLTPRQLADLWVIPEETGKGFTPRNESYDQVDGFWWRGEPKAWFKIPDFSEARVGRNLERFDEKLSRGDLLIETRTNVFFSAVGVLGVTVGRPAWVPDEGDTKAPVRRPKEF